MTRYTSRGETEAVQEAVDEGKTEFDEVVGKFIKMRNSYKISFWLGFFISYEVMK